MAKKKGSEMDVRAALLRAAAELIAESGADGAGVNAVIERAGLSKGTFYHYFQSKEELLEALVRELSARAADAVRHAVSRPDLDAIARLNAFLVASRELKQDRRALVVQLTLALYRDESADLRRRLERATHDELAPLLGEILAQGINEGTLSIRHPHETASLVLGLVHSQREELVRSLLTTQPDARAGLERGIEAFYDALERIVGAPAGSIARPSRALLERWLEVLGPRP